MPTAFDLRFVAYAPGGAKITNPTATIPTLGAAVVLPYNDITTLEIPVSEAMYAALPDYLEVALEYNAGAGWIEPLGARWLINGGGVDDVDATKTNSLTGVNMWGWFLNKSYLNHVKAYTATGISTGTAYTLTASASGTTFTSAGHSLEVGDIVVCTAVGTAKGISKDSSYTVKSTTTNTFMISGSATGAAKNVGTATGVHFSKKQLWLNKTGHQFVNNEKVTVKSLGGADNLSAGQDYYIVSGQSTRFRLSGQINGTPIAVGSVSGMSLTAAPDGERRFNKKTPGFILKTFIDEAQLRGALSPNATALPYDFDATVDSAGTPWPKTFSIGFTPGTTGLQFLQTLLQKGWLEFTTSGRTLHAYVSPHGTDRSTGNTPVRIGVAATARPVKSSLDNLINAVVTVDENGKVLAEAASVFASPLGTLESYQTQAGISEPGTSADIVDTSFDTTTTPNVQWTVTELAAVAAKIPFRDYQAGDTVQFRLRGAWKPLNVASIQLRIDSSGPAGAATIDTVLGYRFVNMLAKVASRYLGLTGGRADTGTGGTTQPWVNSIQPAAPATLAIDTSAVFRGSGSPKASAMISWDPVTDDGATNAVTVSGYEVWGRPDGADNATLLGVTGGDRQLAVDGLDPKSTTYLSVRAISASGQAGAFSSEAEFTTAAPTEVLDTPTAPTLTPNGNGVLVAWDGNLVTGTPPAQLAYVVPRISTSSSGPFADTSQNISQAGSLVVDNLTVGATYWFVLVAVDNLGVESIATTPLSVTVTGVVIPATSVALQSYLVPVGTICTGIWKTAPAGYLILDGSQPAQATYPALFALLNPFVASGVAIPNNTSPAPINFSSAHGLVNGQAIFFQTTGSLPTGLLPNKAYYVTVLSSTSINVSATPGGALIAVTGTSQTGVHSVFITQYGIFATTFGIPDARGKVLTQLLPGDPNVGYLGQSGGDPTFWGGHKHSLNDDGQAEITITTGSGNGTFLRRVPITATVKDPGGNWVATHQSPANGAGVTSAFGTGVGLNGSTVDSGSKGVAPYITVNNAIKY
jgi:hypothetical protein